MTKKRHAKLLRAFITNIHKTAIAQGGYPNGVKVPVDMYKAVRMANAGCIPAGFTREQFWKTNKLALVSFGMADIKEIKGG